MPASANDDFHPAIAGFSDAIRGRHEQLTLAAPDGRNAVGSDATVDQRGSNSLGALTRKRIVELIAAYRIGMADHHQVGYAVFQDLGEYAFDNLLGFVGEFVLPFDGVEREAQRAGRFGRQCWPKLGCYLRGRGSLHRRTGGCLSCCIIGLVENDLLVSLFNHDRSRAAVHRRQ